MSNKLLEELAEFRKNQKNDPTEQTEPIERDWMDKAFDWYYNNESDMAETGDLVILDYDRKMFRMAIERFLPEEEGFSTPEECLKACDEAIKNDSGLDLNPIARDRIESGPVFVPLSRKLEDNQLLGSSIPESPPLESKYEERLKEKEMEGGLRGVPLETLPETLKQGEFMREMELEKRLESKYEDFGKELLEHLYETGHENRQVVGVLIDQIRRALKEF